MSRRCTCFVPINLLTFQGTTALRPQAGNDSHRVDKSPYPSSSDVFYNPSLYSSPQPHNLCTILKGQGDRG
ncbi:hypothetical protein F4861DRAFT_513959 [Xylaria intraflava]|nr:hypothetical protein F4861DRAFT_513959 [Xylaria intraflava]